MSRLLAAAGLLAVAGAAAGWADLQHQLFVEQLASDASLSHRFVAAAKKGFGLLPELSLGDHFVTVPKTTNASMQVFDRLLKAWGANVERTSNHEAKSEPKFVVGWLLAPPSLASTPWWSSDAALEELFVSALQPAGPAFGRVSLHFGSASSSSLHICTGEVHLVDGGQRLDVGFYRISRVCLETGLKAAELSGDSAVRVTAALQSDPESATVSSEGFSWLPRAATVASVRAAISLEAADGTKKLLPASTKSPQLPPIVIVASSICGHTRIGEALRQGGYMTPRYRFVRLMKLPNAAEESQEHLQHLADALRWPSATPEQALAAAKAASAAAAASQKQPTESSEDKSKSNNDLASWWVVIKGYWRHLTMTLTSRVLMPLSLSTLSYRYASSAASSAGGGSGDIASFLREHVEKDEQARTANYYPDGLSSSWPWPYSSPPVKAAYSQLWSAAALNTPELTKEGGSFATVVSSEGGAFCFHNVPSGRYALIAALALGESEGMGLVVAPMARFVTVGGPSSTRPLATPLIAGKSLLEITVDTPTITGTTKISAVASASASASKSGSPGTLLLAFVPSFSATRFKATTSPHWIPYRQACRFIAIPVDSNTNNNNGGKEQDLSLRIGGVWSGNYSLFSRFIPSSSSSTNAAEKLVKQTTWKTEDAEAHEIQPQQQQKKKRSSASLRFFYSQPCYAAADALIVAPFAEEESKKEDPPFVPGAHPLKGVERISARSVLDWISMTFVPVKPSEAVKVTLPPSQHVSGIRFGELSVPIDTANATAVAEAVEQANKVDSAWLADALTKGPWMPRGEEEQEPKSGSEKLTPAEEEAEAELEDDEKALKLPFAPRSPLPPFPVGSGRGQGSFSAVAINFGVTALVVVISVAAIIKPKKKRSGSTGDEGSSLQGAGSSSLQPLSTHNHNHSSGHSDGGQNDDRPRFNSGQLTPTSISSNFSKDSFNSSFANHQQRKAGTAAGAAAAVLADASAPAAAGAAGSGSAAQEKSAEGPASRKSRR